MIRLRKDLLKHLSAVDLYEIRDLIVASDSLLDGYKPSIEDVSGDLNKFLSRDSVIAIRGFVEGVLASVLLILPHKDTAFTKNNPDKALLIENFLNAKSSEMFLFHMFVHPSFRGRGYGIDLVEYTKSVAADKGYKYMLGYNSYNTMSRRFLEKHFGYKSTGIEGIAILEDNQYLKDIYYMKV